MFSGAFRQMTAITFTTGLYIGIAVALESTKNKVHNILTFNEVIRDKMIMPRKVTHLIVCSVSAS